MAKNVTFAKRFMSLMESMEGARGGEKLEVTEVKKILLSQAVLLTNMHKTVLKAAETVRAEREKIEALTNVVFTEVDHRESTVTLLNKIVLLLSDCSNSQNKKQPKHTLAKKRRVQANDERDTVAEKGNALHRPSVKKQRISDPEKTESFEELGATLHEATVSPTLEVLEPFDAVDLDDDDAFKQLFN